MSEEENQSVLPLPLFKLAINLLWASFAIGGLKVLIDFMWLSKVAPAWFVNIVMLFTLAIIAFLIVKIAAKKNWARITFLILFLVGTVPTAPIVIDEFLRMPIIGMLSVIQSVMQIYALFLLFRKPTSDLFRKSESIST